jgi:hypothetical protein
VQNSKDTYPSPYTPSYAQRAIKEGWVNGEEVESWDLQPMRGEGPMSQIGFVFYDKTVSGLR